MPESYVQSAPDSTGVKLRTRQRTVGADTVEEQYYLAAKGPVVTTRAWVSSFRQLVPRAALTATAFQQPIFTVWNGGSKILSLRRLTVEVDTVTGRASGIILPVFRLYRATVAPTGGLALTPVQPDTADAALSGTVAILGDAASDGVAAASALTATPNPTGAYLWEQTFPTWASASITGYMQPSVMTIVPDDPNLQSEDPLFIRPFEGIILRAEGTSQTYIAGDWHVHVKAVIGEFTIP